MDVQPGEKRPEFGCFNVGTAKNLLFAQGRFLDAEAVGFLQADLFVISSHDDDCCRGRH